VLVAPSSFFKLLFGQTNRSEIDCFFWGDHHDEESQTNNWFVPVSCMKKKEPLEMLIWCIALPGFGQLLNGKYLKGVILILLEVIINMGSRLNETIIYSFQGNLQQAINTTNYQWLMFYPCVYMFGIWDAYKDAGGGESPYATMPFVFCAFFGTVGVIYSSTQVFGKLWGPVWLGMIFAGIGIVVGLLLKWLLTYTQRKRKVTL